MTKKIIKSEREMMKQAEMLARALHGGEVILLEGDLGTGKTTFTRGLVRALGVKGVVRSPTFTLLHVHQGKTKILVHVDVYRLRSVNDLRELGIEDYLGKKDVIVVVEWGEKMAKFFSRYHPKRLRFFHGKKSTERLIDH